MSCSRQVLLGVVPPSSDVVRVDGMAGVLLHASLDSGDVDLRVSGPDEDGVDVVSFARRSLDEPGS